MAAPKNKNPAAREAHLAKVAKWFLENKPQWMIAEKLGVTPGQISYDVRVLRKRWRAENSADFEEHLDRQIAQIDHAIDELWEQWHLSGRERTVEQTEVIKGIGKEGGGVREKAARKVFTSDGKDAEYMNLIERLMDQKARLLGIKAPQKVALTDPSGEKEWQPAQAAGALTGEQIVAGVLGVIQSIASRFGGVAPGDAQPDRRVVVERGADSDGAERVRALPSRDDSGGERD